MEEMREAAAGEDDGLLMKAVSGGWVAARLLSHVCVLGRWELECVRVCGSRLGGREGGKGKMAEFPG